MDYFSGIAKENEDAEMEIDRLEKEEKKEKEGKEEKEKEKEREIYEQREKKKNVKKTQEVVEKVEINQKEGFYSFSEEYNGKAGKNEIKTENLNTEKKVSIDQDIGNLKNEEKNQREDKEKMTNTMKKEVVNTDEISPIEFSKIYFQDLLGIKL